MTIQELLTSLRHDMKMPSTDESRDSEFVDYVNRLIRGGIRPILVAFKSDLGLREWTTVSTSDRRRRYDLPSDFNVMSELYCVEPIITGTIASSNSDLLTFVLDSSAASGSDVYNGNIIRFTAGTGAYQQRMVSDYVGSTRTVTVDEPLVLDPDATTTYAIFEVPDGETELRQKRYKELHRDFSRYGEPRVFSLDNLSLVLGDIPDGVYVLDGWYWRREPDLHTDSAVTVVAATDLFTSAAHSRETGQQVRFTTTDTLPSGLSSRETYYVIRVSANTFKVASSFEKAMLGVAADITSNGTGTHTMTDVLPHFGYFDDALRQYAVMLALNRDEYNTKVETSIFSQIQADGFEVLSARKERQSGGQLPLKGSGDL